MGGVMPVDERGESGENPATSAGVRDATLPPENTPATTVNHTYFNSINEGTELPKNPLINNNKNKQTKNPPPPPDEFASIASANDCVVRRPPGEREVAAVAPLTLPSAASA